MLLLSIKAVNVVALFNIYVDYSWTPVASAAIEHANNMDVWLNGALS